MALDYSIVKKISNLISCGQYGEAHELIILFESVIEYPEEFYYAALCYTYGYRNSRIAENYYAKCNALGVNKFWVQYHLSQLYILEGRYEEAFDMLFYCLIECQEQYVIDSISTAFFGFSNTDCNSNNDSIKIIFNFFAKVIHQLNIKSSESVFHLSESICNDKSHLKTAIDVNIDSIDPQEKNYDLFCYLNSLPVSNINSSVFFNSIPKSGTHLLRNIILSLFPHCASIDKFIDIYNINDYLPEMRAESKMYFFGHLPFNSETSFLSKRLPVVCLIRNPVDVLLSHVRSIYSNDEAREDYKIIRQNYSVEEAIKYVIVGYSYKGSRLCTSFGEFYRNFACSWDSNCIQFIKYENLVTVINNPTSIDSTVFFERIASNFKTTLPLDWPERVLKSSNRNFSVTSYKSDSNCPDVIDSVDLRMLATRLIKVYAPGIIEWYAEIE